MAEYLLRQRLETTYGWKGQVHSAGVHALIGEPADESTVALLRGRGIDLGPHRARQLTQQNLRQADLVLVMETHHREAVLDLDPTARGKTFLLGHWTNTEIPDPYRRGDQAHAQAIRLIDATLESWLEKLAPTDDRKA